MSFREIRNFVEMLRVLGYPRIVSMENFRKPNFVLVAELLRWIVGRFNPNSQLPEDLATEQERVVFIKSAVFCLLHSARIKLNPRKLYQADGYAVQELIIPVQMLYNTPRDKIDADDIGIWKEVRDRVNSQLQNITLCRQLASKIPTQGATIYDLLSKELYAKEGRSKALSFSLNLNDVEKCVQEAITVRKDELNKVEENVAHISVDEQALDEKIARKRGEYEQHQKRLVKLQAFRPQHMDEYEKYEAKLKELYESEAAKNEQQQNVEVERNIQNIIEGKRRAEEVAKAKSLASEREDSEKKQIKGRTFGHITGAGLVDDDDDEDSDDDELENYVENLNNEENSAYEALANKDDEEETGSPVMQDDSVTETNETVGGDDEKLESSSNDDF